jgi:CspA family cold shock protein
MHTGTVKWFDKSKGYGFVSSENGSKDIFIHISAVEAAGFQSLNEGQRISFDIESNKGKDSAVNIKKL